MPGWTRFGKSVTEHPCMKIVVVISAMSLGGAERVVSTLTREWARHHHVVVAVFDGRITSYECGGKLIDLRLPEIGRFLRRGHRVIWERSMRLARLFRRERPDLIVSFMESANFPTIVAAALTGVLGRLRVSVRTNPSAIPIPWRWLIPSLYRTSERIIAPSSGVKRRLEGMGVPASKVLVIPNPIAPQAVATDFRRPFTHPYVLGVGRLRVEKGFDRLVSAFADVKIVDLHLVILGEGDHRQKLVALASTLGIGSRAHFPGAVSDVGPWYSHAHCFVLSSRHEGSPNALMEAMANGCAAISFDCRYGPAEILEDEHSGLIVAQDDVEGLTAAIKRVVTDRSLRTRLAAAGRERAKAFGAGPIARHWLAYDRVRRPYSCRATGLAE